MGRTPKKAHGKPGAKGKSLGGGGALVSAKADPRRRPDADRVRCRVKNGRPLPGRGVISRRGTGRRPAGVTALSRPRSGALLKKILFQRTPPPFTSGAGPARRRYCIVRQKAPLESIDSCGQPPGILTASYSLPGDRSKCFSWSSVLSFETELCLGHAGARAWPGAKGPPQAVAWGRWAAAGPKGTVNRDRNPPQSPARWSRQALRWGRVERAKQVKIFWPGPPVIRPYCQTRQKTPSE